MKFFGAGLILLSALSVGVHSALELREREKRLRRLVSSLFTLKSALCAACEPLEIALRRAGIEIDLAQLAELPFSELWDEWAAKACPDGEERELISELGAIVTSADNEGKAAAFDRVLEELQRRCSAAREKQQREGKLAVVASALAGLAAVIILI